MVRLQMRISGLEQPLVERVVDRLLALEPETTAVLLTGSYAKGTATVASDLDLMAITPSPRDDYRTWFEEQSTDAPLHISVGAETADSWLAEAKSPARWALGFPAINIAAYLWTSSASETRRLTSGTPYFSQVIMLSEPGLAKAAVRPSGAQDRATCPS